MKIECPACGSDRVVTGRYLDQVGGGLGQVFRPDGLKVLTLIGSDIRIPKKFSSCLDCGLLWTKLDQNKLTKVLTKHGNKRTKTKLSLALSTLDPLPSQELKSGHHECACHR